MRCICASGARRVCLLTSCLFEFNKEIKISTCEIRCAFQGIDQNIHSDLVIFSGYRRILDCQIPLIES